MPRLLIALALFTGLALLLLWLRPAPVTVPDAATAPAAPPSPGTDAALPVVPELAVAAAAARGLGPLPGSLAGTLPPVLRLDDQGRLLVDATLRDYFEYFLATLGEEDFDAILARIAAGLLAGLPPEAAARAWQILGDYLAYRAAVADVPAATAGELADMRNHLDAVTALRRQYLGSEVADAFFAAEESYDRFTVERLLLARDSSLDADTRARRLAELEAALPPELLAAREDSVRISEVSAAVAQLRAGGAGEAEVRALREQALGSEAAERLAALDREEALWETRYADYGRQRDAIRAAALSAGDREAQLQALRARLFSEPERLRAEALDRIGAVP